MRLNVFPAVLVGHILKGDSAQEGNGESKRSEQTRKNKNL